MEEVNRSPIEDVPLDGRARDVPLEGAAFTEHAESEARPTRHDPVTPIAL